MSDSFRSHGLGGFRYISLIAVVSSALGAVLLFIIGAMKVLKAWIAFIPGGFELGNVGSKTYEANSAIAYIAQGIDCFLIALVLMVFASGIYSIAVVQKAPSEDGAKKGMFEITSIGRLKSILAELVIIILFVKFLEISLRGTEPIA